MPAQNPTHPRIPVTTNPVDATPAEITVDGTRYRTIRKFERTVVYLGKLRVGHWSTAQADPRAVYHHGQPIGHAWTLPHAVELIHHARGGAR